MSTLLAIYGFIMVYQVSVCYVICMLSLIATELMYVSDFSGATREDLCEAQVPCLAARPHHLQLPTRHHQLLRVGNSRSLRPATLCKGQWRPSVVI